MMRENVGSIAPESINKSEIIYNLERQISDTKKSILIVDHDDMEVLSLICKRIVDLQRSDIEVWHCTGLEFHGEAVKVIQRNEMDEILKLYRLYDFSDKVTVISNSDQYGSLFNYVKNELLTKEEMVEALLYGI